MQACDECFNATNKDASLKGKLGPLAREPYEMKTQEDYHPLRLYFKDAYLQELPIPAGGPTIGPPVTMPPRPTEPLRVMNSASSVGNDQQTTASKSSSSCSKRTSARNWMDEGARSVLPHRKTYEQQGG